MTATNLKSTLIAIFTVIALLFSSFSLGEDATTGTEQQMQQQTQQAQDSGGDRSKSAGAAQAMAIAGAAMAGVSCMMGMNEARKMPPGSEKNMMMMMAMQQCSQAAQSAANAAKNDDAKKASQSTPAMAQSKAPKQISSDTNKDDALQMPTETKPDEVATLPDLPEPSPIAPPVIEDPTAPAVTEEPGFVGREVSISALQPIEASKVDFNEANKNDTQTITPPGGASGGLLGFGKAFTPEEVKKLTGEGGGGSGKAGRGVGADEGSVGSDGGGGSPSESGGNGAFDQLLSQLMGGGAPPEMLGGIGGGGDLVALPKEKTTGKGPNIFEYASYRYKVTQDEGRVTTQRRKEATREIASEKTTTLALKPKN